MNIIYGKKLGEPLIIIFTELEINLQINMIKNILFTFSNIKVNDEINT